MVHGDNESHGGVMVMILQREKKDKFSHQPELYPGEPQNQPVKGTGCTTHLKQRAETKSVNGKTEEGEENGGALGSIQSQCSY